MSRPSRARPKPLAREALDRLAAAILLVALGPLLLVIAAAVRLSLGSPVLFRQTRPGLHGRPFTIYKFRTMREPRTEADRYRSDAERLTRFGAWLRRTSLDELPELINVVRGEMSLVGPRPLLMEYLDRYTPEQARRHEVKPGITGWAQVNGRNELGWDERFRMDVWYVDHHSLRLDVRILLMTLGAVLSGHGVSQRGRATVDYFGGTPGGGD